MHYEQLTATHAMWAMPIWYWEVWMERMSMFQWLYDVTQVIGADDMIFHL